MPCHIATYVQRSCGCARWPEHRNWGRVGDPPPRPELPSHRPNPSYLNLLLCVVWVALALQPRPEFQS